MKTASLERRHAWQGPAVLSYGFRPFFLFGALWVVVAMVLWLASLMGLIHLPTCFDPVSWHAHAFLFGYLGAVLAGFLLTAVPNWTGRLPLVGWPLAGLFALWGAGRLAVLFSAMIPAGVAMSVDLAFPIVLGGMILREIIAGKNWRNLIVLALLGMFTLANALFHLEAMGTGYAAQGVGLRLGVATAVMMIALIGGRIIPSFTRSWLAHRDIAARPVPPMQRFDRVVLLASVPVLGAWVLQPASTFTAVALVVFGVAHFARLLRWQGHRTLRDPLVWALHAAYAFIPLGAVALGFGHFVDAPSLAGAQHLWMSGAIGAMTLAVMTRATLGHTGQALIANRATVMIFVCVFAATFVRLCGSVWYEASYGAGVLWIAAFVGFVVAYGPSLMSATPATKG